MSCFTLFARYFVLTVLICLNMHRGVGKETSNGNQHQVLKNTGIDDTIQNGED